MDLNKYTVGTCQFMCPLQETKLREKEGLLHVFEVKLGTERFKRPEADTTKTVKSFCRSAAGHKLQHPPEIRNGKVLLKTIKYLFNNIFPLQKTQNPLLVYDFMFDRLRSIRQDMVVQNLNDKETIQILKPIIKFHIYFGYLFCEKSIQEYDPAINYSHLQECVKRILVCFECCPEKESSFFDSCYLILNLGSREALERSLCLEGNAEFQISLGMSLFWYKKNYTRVFSCFSKLSTLLKCVFIYKLSDIRSFGFKAHCFSYSSKLCSYPLVKLKSTFLYNNLEEVEEDCKHFAVEVQDQSVRFLKSQFDCSVKPVKVRRLDVVDDELSNCDVNELSET